MSSRSRRRRSGQTAGNPWAGRKWAALGTSITDQEYYTTPLTALMGATCQNLGVSSATLSNSGSGNGSIYTQVASITAGTDLVTLEVGINDFRLDVTLGAIGDTATTTFYGALHKSLTDIFAADASRVVVFLTPYANEAGGLADWNTPNANGVRLEAFVSAIFDTAKLFANTHVIDVFGKSGIRPDTLSIYTSDNLHINTVGGNAYADYVFSQLRKIGSRNQPTVATPTFSVDGGSYGSTQSVELSCATAYAAIYYTVDGSTPTTGSTAYSGAISVSTTQTIKAIAVRVGMTNSAVASATYTIGTPFSPADLSPVAWWSAADLSTLWQDTGATSAVTTDGQSVARIDDKSGNARHLSQSTSGLRPLYKTDGTHHWLLFDGSDDVLPLGSAFDIAGTSGNFSIAYASKKAATGNHGVVTGNSTDSYIGDAIFDDDRQPYIQTVSTAVNATQTQASTLDDHVVIASCSSGTVTLYQNGSNVGSGGGGAITGFNSRGFYFGLSGFVYGGRIYELILIPRGLTSQEVSDLTTWLKTQSGTP